MTTTDQHRTAGPTDPVTFMHRTTASPDAQKLIRETVATVRARPEMARPVFLGVGGSFAYGFAHERSDVDVRGVYTASYDTLAGLAGPPRHPVSMKNPDVVMYELGVFIGMVLKANPNVLELLALDQYEQLTDVGRVLLENASALLSQHARTTYIGFATSQIHDARKMFKRVADGDEQIIDRARKHLRHTFRVLEQGVHLLTTGQVQVRVSDPARVARYSELTLEQANALFEQMQEQLATVPSALPEKPDRDAANQLLLRLRRMAG